MSWIHKIQENIDLQKSYIKQSEQRIERLEKAKILIQSNPLVGEVLELLEALEKDSSDGMNQAQERTR